MSSPWVILVETKFNDKCPLRRNTEERHRAGGEGLVRKEAETGAMPPRMCGATRGHKRPRGSSLEGAQPGLHFDVTLLASMTARA